MFGQRVVLSFKKLLLTSWLPEVGNSSMMYNMIHYDKIQNNTNNFFLFPFSMLSQTNWLLAVAAYMVNRHSSAVVSTIVIYYFNPPNPHKSKYGISLKLY